MLKEPTSTVHNMDCMDYMKTLPDNTFNLAVVDPPYGISVTDRHKIGNGCNLVGGGRQTVRW